MLCQFKFFDILSETTYNLDYKFIGFLFIIRPRKIDMGKKQSQLNRNETYQC